MFVNNIQCSTLMEWRRGRGWGWGEETENFDKKDSNSFFDRVMETGEEILVQIQ